MSFESSEPLLWVLRCGATVAAAAWSALRFGVAAPAGAQAASLFWLVCVVNAMSRGALHATAAAAGTSAPAGLETLCCCCVNVAHAHPFRLLRQFSPHAP